MSFFSAERLTAGYGGRTVVRDLSFTLEEGTLTGLLGRNGSGKSTLLKALCGALPHSGSCRLRGQLLEGLSPRSLARLCGYIPQRSGISIDISALEVVLMGFHPRLGLLERPSPSMVDDARQALARAGLEGREEDSYLTLSEGQKQLCILARALAGGASLLLLDEPDSALDLANRFRTLDTLKSWAAWGDRGGLAALHDPNLALDFCDQLLLLEQGRLAGVLRPGEDSLEEMERALSRIYGEICLVRCRDRAGRERLVMLKEGERRT